MTVPAPEHLRFKDVRLTIDTPEDMVLIKNIYEALYKEGEIVDLGQAIQLVKDNPQLKEINGDVKQQNMMSFDARMFNIFNN